MKNTSWGNFADKYDKYLADENSHHAKVIAPNLFRMMGEVKHKKILDVACGQGYFSDLLDREGSAVTAFDVSSELIDIAKRHNKNVNYFVANAESFYEELFPSSLVLAKPADGSLRNNSSTNKFDIAICVLAIQNIENPKKVFENIKNLLKENGKLFIVINHPSFRIPKSSEWVWDNSSQTQFRRVDTYMSEQKIKMDMTPSKKFDKEYTITFHRPLQYYFKIFNNLGLKVARLEEWVGDRESKGPRKEAEDTARKEFPLFMCLEVTL